MGTSTNAEICYGVAFEEDFEFPWGDDLEDWWVYRVHKFKHSFELFDADGNYLNDREPTLEENRRYWKERRDFESLHPPPIELVNYCSSDCPMYIVAVRGSVTTARRGDPVKIDPPSILVTKTERDALMKFFTDFDIEISSDPSWLLTSYWG